MKFGFPSSKQKNEQKQQEQPPPADPLSDPRALEREVRAYMQQQNWDNAALGTSVTEMFKNMSLVAEGIVKSRYLDDSAMIVITTGQCWSGSIMGSDNIQTTWDGCGTGYHSVPCSGFFGSYSLAMQRTDESYGSEFLVQAWKGGELLKQAVTKADYGVVSFAGDC